MSACMWSYYGYYLASYSRSDNNILPRFFYQPSCFKQKNEALSLSTTPVGFQIFFSCLIRQKKNIERKNEGESSLFTCFMLYKNISTSFAQFFTVFLKMF